MPDATLVDDAGGFDRPGSAGSDGSAGRGGAAGMIGGAAGTAGGRDGGVSDGITLDGPSVEASADGPRLDAPVTGDAPPDGTAPDSSRADASTIDGGAGDAVVIPPWMGLEPVLLTGERALELFVAKDERHVAYSTDRAESSAFGCIGRNAIGELKSFVTDPLPGVAVSIDTYAGIRESFFTDDGQSLVFTHYTRGVNPCADQVDLLYAPSAGGTSRALFNSIAYYYHDISIAGSTALWRSFGGSASDTGTRGVRQLGGAGTSLGSGALLQTDPTGTFLLDDRQSQLRIASLTGASKVVLNDGTLGINVRWAWSADGQRLAYAHRLTNTDPVTLELVASDGSARSTLSTACRCSGFTFSPNGTSLAYDLAEADGSVSFVVASVVSPAGATVKVSGLPANAGAPKWSANGMWLEVSTTEGFLWVGPAAGGTFVRLTAAGAHKGDTVTWSADQAFVAFNEIDASNASALVVAANTGARRQPFASGVTGLWYEGAAPSRLAVAVTLPGGTPTMYLLPADGAGPSQALRAPPLPAYPFALWVGHVLVYLTNRHTISGTSVADLVAVNEDGTQEGLLATDLILQPKAGRPNPTRLFYVRAPVSGGGLYMFAPPAP